MFQQSKLLFKNLKSKESYLQEPKEITKDKLISRIAFIPTLMIYQKK